tara:strand:+ start:2133 stop:2765 length:633 start_codon:yes stop_codon:yes gene_type:complete
MRPAVDVFSEWADAGKDIGMERGHAPAVGEILTAAFEEMNLSTLERGFTVIDAGCGNGWVVRMLAEREDCVIAMGIDGAPSMIANALEVDPDGMYTCADLMVWRPPEPVDLVHSMEVLYYLDDIPSMLHRIRDLWLVPGGVFAFGVDHYAENEDSISWPEKVGVHMTTLSEKEWIELVESAGFDVLRCFLSAPGDGWPGTLSVIARAPSI